MIIRRGDIYYADLRPVVGSEQGGVRPVLIIQNDVGNKHSPTVICAAITSKMNKAKLPTHVELSARQCDMVRDSVILLERCGPLINRDSGRKYAISMKIFRKKSTRPCGSAWSLLHKGVNFGSFVDEMWQ